ncbi:MAG: hypothetical protein ACE5PT_06490 [Gemmatimonadales bacterium]
MRVLVLAGAMLAPGAGAAQVTGAPSFNAPYRAFGQHEFGGTLSFPGGADFAVEGQYRFGHQQFDIGARGGIFQPGGNADTRVVLGATARQRVITHTEELPLDGAVLVGIGAQLVSGGSTVLVPAGISLGRRLEFEDSDISVVAYGQPTVLLKLDGGSDIDVALGLGADIRLSRLFDLRVSVGLGDLEGIAVSAVWIR